VAVLKDGDTLLLTFSAKLPTTMYRTGTYSAFELGLQSFVFARYVAGVYSAHGLVYALIDLQILSASGSTQKQEVKKRRERELFRQMIK
jgi:hypothetical protein